MAKDDLVYVGHMLDMAEKALRLAEGKTRDEFDTDETLSLALTHLVQIIGEAARRVGSEFAGRIRKCRGERSSECAIVWSINISTLTVT